MLAALQCHLSRFGQALRLRKESPQANPLQGLVAAFHALARSEILRAGVLIAAGSLLALQAYRWSREESLRTWLKEHAPSALVSSHALALFGFRALTDPEQVTRAIRWLPTQMDTTAEFWTAPGLSLIVYFAPGSSGGLEPLVLRADSPAGVAGGVSLNNGPKDWQPLGIGWTGLENALEKAHSRPPPPLASRARKPPRPTGDPREFTY